MNNSVREGDAPPFRKLRSTCVEVEFFNFIVRLCEGSERIDKYSACVGGWKTHRRKSRLCRDSPLVSMEVPLRTAYGQNGRCGMQPKANTVFARRRSKVKAELKLYELVRD
ncbi:hypothetical protein TNCV_2965771 [Trichonephila clavipes]|nr:hypothetical protein TNCV_2965771 [Trichonephila clavipes]